MHNKNRSKAPVVIVSLLLLATIAIGCFVVLSANNQSSSVQNGGSSSFSTEANDTAKLNSQENANNDNDSNSTTDKKASANISSESAQAALDLTQNSAGVCMVDATNQTQTKVSESQLPELFTAIEAFNTANSASTSSSLSNASPEENNNAANENNNTPAGNNSAGFPQAEGNPNSQQGLDVGFVVYDINTGKGITYNTNSEFFSASTIKAPFVTSVVQQSDETGTPKFTDKIEEDLYFDGTGTMAYDDETTYSVEDVLTNTITHSDNVGYALLRENFNTNNEFETWCNSAGVDASLWQGVYYPSYSALDLAKMWLATGSFLTSSFKHAQWLNSLLQTGDLSFIRNVSPEGSRVLSKAGYEMGAGMNSLNDAGVVVTETSTYVIAIMSNAPYDDEYYTINQQPIENLASALITAHDKLLAK